jgi:hypothetical protein
MYTNNGQTEDEIMETTLFTIASKKLVINLMKKMKGIFKLKYRPVKKDIEEDYRRWKDLLCSWISRINLLKMGILPKAIYMFNGPHQNSHEILH